MNIGALLDNLHSPADSSYQKLRDMKASCVGTLWTQGTKHKRHVYERCEQILDRPEYVIRVGGHRQTPAEWLADARDALAEVPDTILAEGRVVLVAGNEGNIEFSPDGTDYGRFYAALNAEQLSVPILFACPSLGIDGWSHWLFDALTAAGLVGRGIVNLYAENVGRIGDFAGIFSELYVGEVNSPPWMRDGLRVEFMGQAFATLRRAGVKAALIFIAGGESWGSWDENYIISDDEARGIGNIEREVATMPKAAIAIIGSNQDKNVSSIIPAYNEAGGMRFISPLVEQALLNAGYNAKWFDTGLQSADTYHLENLIKQTEAAHAWLGQQPEGVKFAVNLHTDSGDFSHTFGIYGSTREAESAKIASLLGETVHEAMGTAEFRSFDKLGANDYNSYVFYALAKYPAVLIEICSHENRRDIEALWANPQAVAQGILQGVQEYVGAGGIDWKAEATAYRDKLRDVTAALERERGRIKFIKEAVANA